MDEFSVLPPAEPAPVPMAGPTPDKRWSALRNVPRRALTISLATTALVVAGGAVLAGAVTAAPAGGNGTPTPAAPGQMAPNGKGMRMAGPMQAVHGEYVVPNGQGGYQTEEMQRGSVTAVNGDTFTVKSDDGYTHEWVTDSNTMQGMQRRMLPKNDGTTKVPAPTDSTTNGALTTGQNVMVMGTKDGDTFHAVRVMPVRQFGGQQQNGEKAPFQGDQRGPRRGGFGGMKGGPMQGGQMQGAAMPKGDVQSAPTPDQAPTAPESSPTPTQSS